MKLTYPRIALPLAALAIALGLGACGRAEHVAGSVTGPSRGGAGSEAASGCPSLIANDANSSFDMITEVGTCAQFRSNRVRLETIADATELSVLAMGPCIADDAPTISITSAHANVFVHGTNKSVTTTGSRLTFGAVLPVGAAVEPGIVLATDALGNIFEIIFPELAGLGTGSPIVRVQLTRWNLALINSNTSLDVTFDFVAQQNGVRTFFKGHCEGMHVDGTPVVNGGGAAMPPCPTTLTGTTGATANTLADLVQFRPGKRARFEVTGDVATNTINAMGTCAASDAPTIHITGGRGNVFQSGSGKSVTVSGQELVFGPIVSPGVAIEPGVVLGTDQFGDVLEIIWPSLAGLPAGAPIMRLELASWNSWIQTGRQVDVTMEFNVTGPDGSTATYAVRANHITVPVAR
jgi:hypothetical protein